jgi:hypothetical protein
MAPRSQSRPREKRNGSRAVGGLVRARGRITPELIRVFDSTLWKVVLRMKWANWRHQHCEQKAVRLHVKLRPAAGTP